MMARHIQYITNADGERSAVILTIEEYENLLEDLHVLAAAYEAKGQPCVPLTEVIEELRADGELD